MVDPARLRDLFDADQDDTAEIIEDPEYGYDRVVPRADVIAEIEETFCAAIADAERAWAEDRKKMMKNEAAYEGKGDPEDVLNMITIPVAKQIINQQTAWVANQILNQHPVITVKPLDDSSYQMPSSVNNDGSMITKPVKSVDAGKLYEAFLEYKLGRQDFGQLIDDTVYALGAGENPTFWKVEYEPRTTMIKRRRYAKLTGTDNVVKILGPEDIAIPDGEAVKIKHIFSGNCLMPIDQHDIQRSPWFSEKTPMSTLDMWKDIKDGKINFALGPDAEPPLSSVAAVLDCETNVAEDETSRWLGLIDQHVTSEPDRMHDVRTLWFYYPLRRTVRVGGEDGKSNSLQLVEIRSLCAKLHYPAQKLLALYVNPYPDRPYEPFFIRKRPHRFSGTSPSEDLAPFQRLISQILHVQLQNAVQLNVKVFLVRKGSSTWRYLQKPEGKLRPGLIIEYDDPQDIKAEQLGAPVQSMYSEINYLTSQAQRLAVEPDYSQIPNRLPAATFAQNETQAKTQPQFILRAIRRPIARTIERYLKIVAQYHNYESVPFVDPETNQRVSRLISFPPEVFEQHFAFEVTATGDEDSVGARVERGAMLLKETNVENEAALKLLALIMDPHMPAETKEPAVKMLVRLETLYGDILGAVRPDSGKFVMSEQFIRDVMSRVPPAPTPPPPPPAEPQPPKINIALSGQLPPEIVAAIVAMAGIQGGQNAAPELPLPGAQPGGAPLLPGAGGPGGPLGEPGNPGMAEPNAPPGALGPQAGG